MNYDLFFFKLWLNLADYYVLKRHPFHRYRDNTVIANSFHSCSWDYHTRFRDISPPKQKAAIMHKLIPSNEEEKTDEEEGGGQQQIDRAEKIR